MPKVSEVQRPGKRSLKDDFSLSLEIYKQWRKLLSDNITTKYGSLQGFMEYLFESDGLQTKNEQEARSMIRDSNIITGEVTSYPIMKNQSNKVFIFSGDRIINLDNAYSDRLRKSLSIDVCTYRTG